MIIWGVVIARLCHGRRHGAMADRVGKAWTYPSAVKWQVRARQNVSQNSKAAISTKLDICITAKIS
jgi:hypothetical protein